MLDFFQLDIEDIIKCPTTYLKIEIFCKEYPWHHEQSRANHLCLNEWHRTWWTVLVFHGSNAAGCRM